LTFENKKLAQRIALNFTLFLQMEIRNRGPATKYCYSLLARNKHGERVFDLAKKYPELMEILVDYLPREDDSTVNSYMEKSNENPLCLQLSSDLHIEFGHKVGPLIDPHAPFLALLGDIGTPARKKRII